MKKALWILLVKKLLWILLALVCGVMCAASALGVIEDGIARGSIGGVVLFGAVALPFGIVAREAWSRARGGRPSRKPRPPYTPGGTLFDD